MDPDGSRLTCVYQHLATFRAGLARALPPRCLA